MAFATYADLEDRLRVTFDVAEQVQAAALLDQVTAIIQAETRQTIEQVSGDTVTLDGNGGTVLQLPQTPVTTVTSVTVDGTVLTAGDDYLFNGPTGLLYRTSAGVWTQVPQWGVTWGSIPQSVVVVYTHGYAAAPADVNAVCVEVAARAWSAPAGAVRQESIGSYSVTYDTGAQTTSGVALTDAEKMILDSYRIAALV